MSKEQEASTGRETITERGRLSRKSFPRTLLSRTTPSQQRKAQVPRLSDWTFEILGILLSLASFVATVVVLWKFDGKALDSWKAGVSINTIIAITSTACRASLAFAVGACIGQGKWNFFRKQDGSLMTFDRFDDSSRGSLGSVRLLWWSKMRHWVCLGAFVTIIMNGFEPFLQAIVDFEGQLDTIATSSTSDISNSLARRQLDDVDVELRGNSGAFIARSNRLDIGFFEKSSTGGLLHPGAQMGNNITTFPWNARPDFGATAAMLNGFAETTNLEALKSKFFCQTGNCTWTVYTSLAVCSRCVDVTSNLSKTSGLTSLGEDADISNPILRGSNVAFDGEFPYSKWELPGTFVSLSNLDQQYDGNGDRALAGGRDTLISGRFETNPGRTVAFKDSQALMGAFQYIRADDSYESEETSWEDTKATAGECGLYFCTNLYRAKVEEGRLTDELIQSFAERAPGSYESVSATDAALSREWTKLNNNTLYFYGKELGRTDVERSDLQLVIPADEIAEYNLPQESLVFNISQKTVASTIFWLADDFGRLQADFNITQLIYPAFSTLENPSGLITSAGESSNITLMFDKVAASLTKWIRDLPFDTAAQPGFTQQWTIHIVVSWVYIVWPAATLLLGCLFAIQAIWETRRRGLPAWKDSSLITLAYGLDHESKSLVKEAAALGRLDKLAKRTTVQMRESGSGWDLVLSGGTVVLGNGSSSGTVGADIQDRRA